MKCLYIILGLLSLSSFSSQAQDWNPFPYDSVYFINEDNDMDILIPVVKSSDPDDLLLRMFTRWEQGFIKRSDTILNLPPYEFTDSIGAHWFGDDLNYDGGILSFKSVFSDQNFTIDLGAELGVVDTQSFTMANNQFYLLVKTESQEFDISLNDSIKTITLTVTDSVFDIKEFTYNPVDTSESCTNVELFDLGYSSLNKSIVIGKATGIQKIPNLAFYPYCRSYVKDETIDEVTTALKDYHFNVGDIIEGIYRYANYHPTDYYQNNYDYRKEILSFEYDSVNNKYIYTADYTWKQRPYTIYEELHHDPNKEFTVTVWNDGKIFTGIGDPIHGHGQMLRKNSKWGYPLIQGTHMVRYASGGSVGSWLGYMEWVSHGNRFLPRLPGEGVQTHQITTCITYMNIGGVEFGNEGVLSVPEEEEVNPFQVAFNNGVLKFNTAIKGQVHVYDVNGKRIADYDLGEETDMLKFPEHINKGVYIIRFEDINEVIKVVY